MKRFLMPALVAALLAAGAAGQFALSRINPSKNRAAGESAAALLGGFRSVAAEVVWFRIDWLQERGRFSEIAQLSSILSFLEPHVPEVWVYSAWNLAYNISARIPREEDRWVWGEESVSLLRDKGLKWNPSSHEIYRELVSLFMLKIGGSLDSASPLYREKWKETVTRASSDGDWSSIGMDKNRMDAIERAAGAPVDWTNPFASALYWACAGRDNCGERHRAAFAEMARQSKILYDRNK